MAWIEIPDDTAADDELKGVLAAALKARGSVANILKIHSVHPKVLLRHLDLYVEVMFGRSELSRMERETIAVVVSSANRCHY